MRQLRRAIFLIVVLPRLRLFCSFPLWSTIMEMFLFQKVEYNRQYNCSIYSVDAYPFEFRRRTFEGYLLVVFGIIAEIAYIPCLSVILKMRKHSCYKFMSILGCVDVTALPVVAIATGILGIKGMVFCSAPTLIYCLGAVIMVTWIFHSWIALLLAINRCLSVFHSQLTTKLFSGNKPYLWAVSASIYAIYFGMFTRTPLFTSLGFSWFFNPHYKYIPGVDEFYHSMEHTYHNLFISISTVLLYSLFGIMSVRNWNQASASLSLVQKKIFVQVFLISFCTCVASTTYVFMNFSFGLPGLAVVSSFTYFGIHGVPPIIYFCLNNSIRDRLQRAFFRNSLPSVYPMTST